MSLLSAFTELLEALKRLLSNSVKSYPWAGPLTIICLFVVLSGWLCNQSDMERKPAAAVVQRFNYQDFATKMTIFLFQQDYLATPTPNREVHGKDCNKALQIY